MSVLVKGMEMPKTEEESRLLILTPDGVTWLTQLGIGNQKFDTIEVPAWIPVTERLPECNLGAEVGNIEWISCGMVHAGCFGRGGKYRDAYFRTWTDAGEGMDAKDADYWRAVTLPEPPKDELIAKQEKEETCTKN